MAGAAVVVSAGVSSAGAAVVVSTGAAVVVYLFATYGITHRERRAHRSDWHLSACVVCLAA